VTSDETHSQGASEETDRAARLASKRGSRRRRTVLTSVCAVVLLGIGAGAYVAVDASQNASGASAPSATTNPPTTHKRITTTTTAKPTTTTTTIPPVAQPKDAVLPDPGNGIGEGSRGPSVFAYEARLKELHFDPGKVDDYFDQDTWYAVSTVQKYFGLPRTGEINGAVDMVLTHFRYTPAEPRSEPDRVEINLDTQVLTLYKDWQPQLLTTTSTGSGEHFCGGVDGCQYAITPTGHFHFYSLYKGWQKGKLGTMWNPYYFNGSDAVHGLASVPNYPASHGCARIPMHIADYFYTLVHDGESVFVVGAPMHAGSGYVGPAPTTPAAVATTTVPTVPSPPVTKPSTSTTVKSTGTTVKSTPTTLKPPHTTTTVAKPKP
jgi:putative peptidoglycan binding protein/L,D-transpeptidase-like protein